MRKKFGSSENICSPFDFHSSSEIEQIKLPGF